MHEQRSLAVANGHAVALSAVNDLRQGLLLQILSNFG